MLQHNLFCSFTQNIINKKESFKLTHIEYDQINNQFLSSYVQSTISRTIVDLWLIRLDLYLVPVGHFYMPWGWRSGEEVRRR